MKVALRQVIDSIPALNEFGATEALPIRTTYWTSKLLRKVERESKDYNAARIKLAEKHSGGKKTPDGRRYDFEPEALAAFTKEHDELMDTEVEISVDKFTLEMLGDANVKPTVLAALDWLIVEE